MSRAFTKERDDAPEPPVGRVARTDKLTITAAGLPAVRARIGAIADPQERAREEELLATAEIVAPPADRRIVGLGARVEVDGTGKNRSIFTIVGALEEDVRAGKIADDSPLALALLGHRAGDRVVWERPIGPLTLRIAGVTYDDAPDQPVGGGGSAAAADAKRRNASRAGTK